MNKHSIIKKTMMITCIVFISLSSIPLNACSLESSDSQNGLETLRYFAEIPESTPSSIAQAKISLYTKIPLGSSKKTVIDYIDTKKNKNTPFYLKDDNSKISYSIVYNTIRRFSYEFNFVFDENQRLKDIQIHDHALR